MKVYLINVNGEYVGTKAQPFNQFSYYNRRGCYTLDTVSDPESGRHYEKKGSANAYLRNLNKLVKRCADELENKVDQIDSGTASNWVTNLRSKYEGYRDRCKNLLTDLDTATVDELEIEKEYSNTATNRRKEIKFQPPSGHQIFTENNTRRFCKKCGVQLKNVPAIRFKHGNCVDICVFCMREVASEVERAYDAMDAEWRQEVETARFMERM